MTTNFLTITMGLDEQDNLRTAISKNTAVLDGRDEDVVLAAEAAANLSGMVRLLLNLYGVGQLPKEGQNGNEAAVNAASGE